MNLALTVEKIGNDNLMDFIPPSPDFAQSILYTSGTTGNVGLGRTNKRKLGCCTKA